MLGQPASFWGLIASGLLILLALIYVVYFIFVKKIRFSAEFILILILLFGVLIGIHSLQHQGQEVHYNLRW